MFKTLGLPEIILIFVIILIFFGVGKLPQVGEAMGKAIHAFKKSQSGEDEDTVATEKSTTKRLTKSK